MDTYNLIITSVNGALTAVATLVLAIITYLYLVETRKQRKLTESILLCENCDLEISFDIAPLKQNQSEIHLRIDTKNLGSKPAYQFEFKILTKRSPRECISQSKYPENEEYHKEGYDLVLLKTVSGIQPGERLTYKAVILPGFLDYDKTFYVWIKYLDFYKNKLNVIRKLAMNEEYYVPTENIYTGKDDNKVFKTLPISYR